MGVRSFGGVRGPAGVSSQGVVHHPRHGFRSPWILSGASRRRGVPAIKPPKTFGCGPNIPPSTRALRPLDITTLDGVIVQELETFGYAYTRTGVQYTAPDGLHDDC